MAQRAGRTVCPRCGANNFDHVATCWKCGVPLTASGMSPAPAPPPGGPTRDAYRAEARPEMRQEAPGHAPPSYPLSSAGDSGVARRAAIALALTLPWIGLPVGWVFMMIEDSRKQSIGRLCATWSMVALVFHLLLMFALGQSAVGLIREAAEIAAKSRTAGRDSGSGLP